MPQGPPAIVMGGAANALSVARSLARAGITVHAINEPKALVRYSRFARWIPLSGEPEAWAEYLLGPASAHLLGAVILACGDDAIELICDHHAALSSRYVLEEAAPEIRRRMLSKLETYIEGRAAGVPTTRFWPVDSIDSVRALRGELTFPLLIKPVLTHIFQQREGRKFVRVAGWDELLRELDRLGNFGGEFILMEFVPGPDDRLCSYYTYLDAAGNPLFDFTKRIIRRYPTNMGPATYHVTDWVPDVREVGLKFLQHTGFRGLANVEFKWDARDGKLKLIECNARFTAADSLIRASGLDLPLFVYSRLTGRETPPVDEYRKGLHLWNPREDMLAFLELRRRGALTLSEWLRGLAHRQVLPAFTWSDPLPSVVDEARWSYHAVKRLVAPRRR